ncbi:helix-turn-helix domain-containing protein [Neptunicoccus sediminis]|uniref:helix-turn-helix domain-containing protein n=1 Tax=Neptunicoccus sediminis TaxID=1892596 RepID=UPI0012FFB76D|nr:helix-turn-helix domain-containing protein [Neptunicoccus sediminis]
MLKVALGICRNNLISLFDLQQCIGATDLPAAKSQSLADTTTPALVYDERRLILDALSSSRWNVSEAARKLGIGRATLNRKLKRYGISRPS